MAGWRFGGGCLVLALVGCGDDCSRPWFRDFDGDGYGDPDRFERGCEAPDEGAWVRDARDCDDERAATHPDAPDTCNGLDDDCDGAVDPAGTEWYPDADGDGFGLTQLPITACEPPRGFVDQPGDCDDQRRDAHPGAPERCNDLDDDCDLDVDEGAPATEVWYEDLDDDGYGGALVRLCKVPPYPTYSRVPGDCDDRDPDVSPAALEQCNFGIDDDCDRDADNLDYEGATGMIAHYRDRDGDLYGDDDSLALRCVDNDPSWVFASGDCADNDAARNPGMPETCGPLDEDCDGLLDEQDPTLSVAGGAVEVWPDLDRDGFGAGVGALRCEATEPGWAAADDDCDDGDPLIGPDRWWAEDGDLDGAGTGDLLLGFGCEPPVPGLPNVSFADCDDTDATFRPGVPDVCGDGLDADCSGFDRLCGGPWVGVFRAATTAAGELAATAVGLDAADLDGDGLTDLVVGGDGAVRLVFGPPPERPGPFVATAEARGGFGATVLAARSGPNLQVFAVDADAGLLRWFDVVDRRLFPDGQLAIAGDLSLVPGNLPPGPSGQDRFLLESPSELSLFDPDPVSGFSRTSTFTRGGAGAVRSGGDPDGDGAIDAAVGEKPLARVLVFAVETAGGGPLDGVAHTIVTGPPGSQFGAAVAWVDWDDDGLTDLVVGAPDADVTGTDAGAVYVFSAPFGAVGTSDAILTLLGSTPGDRLGSSLEVMDIDGDFDLDLLVGAPEAALGNPGSGAVVAFPHGLEGVTDALSARAGWYGEVQAGLGAQLWVRELDDQHGADLLVRDAATVWWFPGP